MLRRAKSRTRPHHAPQVTPTPLFVCPRPDYQKQAFIPSRLIDALKPDAGHAVWLDRVQLPHGWDYQLGLMQLEHFFGEGPQDNPLPPSLFTTGIRRFLCLNTMCFRVIAILFFPPLDPLQLFGNCLNAAAGIEPDKDHVTPGGRQSELNSVNDALP